MRRFESFLPSFGRKQLRFSSRGGSAEGGESYPPMEGAATMEKKKKEIFLIALVIWVGMFGVFYIWEVRMIPVWLFLSIFFFNWFLEEWRDLGR